MFRLPQGTVARGEIEGWFKDPFDVDLKSQ